MAKWRDNGAPGAGRFRLEYLTSYQGASLSRALLRQRATLRSTRGQSVTSYLATGQQQT